MDVLRKLILVLAIPALFALGGCGYQLTSHPSLATPVSGKRIAVPLFVNKSYKPNLGAFMTESLVDLLATRSGGKVVDEEKAELLLTGTIVSSSNNAISYSAADTVMEYRAIINIEAALTEKKSQKVLWKGTLSWSQDYPVNTVVALQQNSEEAAYREICDKLALQLYEKVADGF